MKEASGDDLHARNAIRAVRKLIPCSVMAGQPVTCLGRDLWPRQRSARMSVCCGHNLACPWLCHDKTFTDKTFTEKSSYKKVHRQAFRSKL